MTNPGLRRDRRVRHPSLPSKRLGCTRSVNRPTALLRGHERDSAREAGENPARRRTSRRLSLSRSLRRRSAPSRYPATSCRRYLDDARGTRRRIVRFLDRNVRCVSDWTIGSDRCEKSRNAFSVCRIRRRMNAAIHKREIAVMHLAPAPRYILPESPVVIVIADALVKNDRRSVDHEPAGETSRHDGNDVARYPAAGAANFQRRQRTPWRGLNHDVARNARRTIFGREINRDEIPHPVQPHAVRADRQIRSAAENVRFVHLLRLRIRRTLACTIQLKSNAGDAPTARSLRSHKKRQVKAVFPRVPVEIEPFGPRLRARRHIGNGMKSIERLQCGPCIGRGPRRIRRRIGP